MSWVADIQDFFVLIYGPGVSLVLPSLFVLALFVGIVRLFFAVFLPDRGPK